MNSRLYFSRSLEQFELILSRTPDDADMHFFYGLKLADENKVEQAVQAFKKAIELDTNHAAAAAYCCYGLLDLGHFSEAESYAQKGVMSDDFRAKILSFVCLARLRVIEGNYDEAYDFILQAIRNEDFDWTPTCYVDEVLTEIMRQTHREELMPAKLMYPYHDSYMEIEIPDGRTVRWRVRCFQNLAKGGKGAIVVGSYHDRDRNFGGLNNEQLIIAEIVKRLNMVLSNVVFIKYDSDNRYTTDMKVIARDERVIDSQEQLDKLRGAEVDLGEHRRLNHDASFTAQAKCAWNNDLYLGPDDVVYPRILAHARGISEEFPTRTEQYLDRSETPSFMELKEFEKMTGYRLNWEKVIPTLRES